MLGDKRIFRSKMNKINPTGSNSKPLLSILMPVRNETVNVSIMVKILNAVFECDDEILIVCDNEEDLSVPLVRELQKSQPNLKLVINRYGR